MDQRIPGLDTVVQAAEPKVRNASAAGDTIDLTGYNAATMTLHVGVYTDGAAHTFILQESADGTAFTTVAAAQMDGTLPAITSTANDQVVATVHYLGAKRYIRLYCTITTPGSTGLLWGGLCSLGLATYRS